MLNKVFGVFLTLAGFAAPVMFALGLMPKDLSVLWGFVPMAFLFLVYAVFSEKDKGGKATLLSGMLALAFGIIVTALVIIANITIVLWLTVIMTVVSFFAFAMVQIHIEKNE